MDFSLKLVVSMLIAMAVILILGLLLQSQTGGFPAYVGQMIPG